MTVAGSRYTRSFLARYSISRRVVTPPGWSSGSILGWSSTDERSEEGIETR